jgi:hypothetical protein
MGRYSGWDIRQSPRGFEGAITCDHSAARYILNGTQPHLIRPPVRG